LAQDTEIILLDEPTAFLDLSHQVKILSLLKDLNRSRGRTVLVVTHDLNLAGRFFDRIHLLKAGRLLASGTPEEVLTPEQIRRAFEVEAHVERRESGLHVWLA